MIVDLFLRDLVVSKGFDIPDVVSDKPPIRMDADDGPMYIPEREPVEPSEGRPISHGRLKPIYSPAVLKAYEQNQDYTSIKYRMQDPEHDFFRDQYSRNRLHTAMGESNLTKDGYHYGAPQQTRTLAKLTHTYLDSMGIYPGGHNNGSFERTWTMN